MDEKIYAALEKELAKCGIDEEAEDILLDMAEKIEEAGILKKEVSVKEKYKKTVLEAFGTCFVDEEAKEESSVYIRLLRVGKSEFVIDDYLL